MAVTSQPLSPWPDDGICALGEMASARVERKAPSAPQATKDKAVIRHAGYMWQSDYGGVKREELGPKNTEWTVNHAATWRNSGAGGLLAPWRIRRAGLIG